MIPKSANSLSHYVDHLIQNSNDQLDFRDVLICGLHLGLNMQFRQSDCTPEDDAKAMFNLMAAPDHVKCAYIINTFASLIASRDRCTARQHENYADTMREFIAESKTRDATPDEMRDQLGHWMHKMQRFAAEDQESHDQTAKVAVAAAGSDFGDIAHACKEHIAMVLGTYASNHVRDAEEADPDTMIEAAKIAHDELNHHATVINMLMEGPKND